MNRLFAAVAISALVLSGAAFAADVPATAPATSPALVQKAQAPSTTKSMVDDHGKKTTTVKKSDKKATTGTVSTAK